MKEIDKRVKEIKDRFCDCEESTFKSKTKKTGNKIKCTDCNGRVDIDQPSEEVIKRILEQ